MEHHEHSRESLETKNMKIFAAGLAGTLGVLLLASASVGIYRVYAKSSTDKFTLTVAKVLHLPVMKVNGHRVLYSEYADDMRAIQTLVNYDQTNNGSAAGLTEEQMSDQVLWRLANNILVKEAAAKFNVSVTKEDMDSLVSNLLQSFESEDKINTEIQARYGWTFDQYKNKVVNSYILQQKIAEKIQTDQASREQLRNKAMQVLNEIKAGKDFAEEASLYGEDGTKSNGGDLGWFGKGDMVPEFENAVFALKPGEITQDLVETQYGFHIIKLEEVKTEKVTDPTTKKTEDVQKVRARHILFRFPDSATYLDSAAKNANIHLYIKAHNPFTSTSSTEVLEQ